MTFNLTSRVSELGRGEVAGRPGNGRPMQYETSLASWYQYGHTKTLSPAARGLCRGQLPEKGDLQPTVRARCRE
jgi:hypothetical protein